MCPPCAPPFRFGFLCKAQCACVHREHPELGQAMIGKLPAAEDPMRLAVGLYYDGLGLSNPLGVAAGR